MSSHCSVVKVTDLHPRIWIQLPLTDTDKGVTGGGRKDTQPKLHQ